MPYHPKSGHPDIFVHSRRNRADHPAISVAGTHFFAYCICFLTIPELIPRLRIEITHDFLMLRPIARHDVTKRIDKEGIEAHITGKQSLLTVNIVDQSMVEIRAEPLFGAVGLQKLVDKRFKMLCDHFAIMDDVA